MSSDCNLRTSLENIVVVEIGDQMGDYAGLLLAGLGAEVIKIEPKEGSPSRSIGPFASAAPDPEQSIFFWRYNLNKKSVVLDIDNPAVSEPLRRILSKADILLLAGEFATVEDRLARYRELAGENPRLIVCAVTPFGLDGPDRELKSTDLTQMALGGIIAVCGYDPDEEHKYDTPPIAPAMWHSYHIGGEYAVVATMAALNFRDVSGEGQLIDVSVHEAINTCTEIAMPTYIYNGETVLRQTARHAAPAVTQVRLSTSADNVYMLASLSPFEREERACRSRRSGWNRTRAENSRIRPARKGRPEGGIYLSQRFDRTGRREPVRQRDLRACTGARPGVVADSSSRGQSAGPTLRRSRQLCRDRPSRTWETPALSWHCCDRWSCTSYALLSSCAPTRGAYGFDARIVRLHSGRNRVNEAATLDLAWIRERVAQS